MNDDVEGMSLEQVVEQEAEEMTRVTESYPQPSRAEKHEAFVYLLGVYARNYEPKVGNRRDLDRTIKDRNAAATFEDAVFKLIGKRAKKRGNNYHVYSPSLVEKLRKTLEEGFYKKVKTRRDYQLFLQGIFDVSEATLYMIKKERPQYQFPVFNEENARRVLVSLFNLDIFPYTDGQLIAINGPHNLRQVNALELDRKQKNRDFLERWLPGQEEYSLEQYYTGRKLVREAFERGEKKFLQRIAAEVGVVKTRFYEWVCDIAQEHGQLANKRKGRPKLVARYEELRILLNMPNKYTGEGRPREEKEPEPPYHPIILHTGNKGYTLTAKAQQDYLKLGGEEVKTELDEEDIHYLERELGKEKDDTTGDLTFRKKGDRIEGITYNKKTKDASIGEVNHFIDGIRGKGIGVNSMFLDMS